MTKFALFLGCAAALVLAGCSSDSGRRSGGEEDGGGIVLMDSGTDTDSGMTGTDSGAGGSDSGTGARECAAMLMALPSDVLPRCSAETQTCVSGCTDGACLQGCMDADTTEPVMVSGTTIDCGVCVNYQLFYCLDSMGCHDQVAALNCCVEDNCGSAADVNACAQSMCSTEFGNLNTCAGSSGCTYTSGPAGQCYGS